MTTLALLCSWFLLLLIFIVVSLAMHALATVLALSGLPAFLLYCLPMVLLISYTTSTSRADFLRRVGRYGGWSCALILSLAALAWLITWLVG